MGPGIFPGLLGDWDIPRTAWGLGYPQDCLGVGISPRTAWGLGYLSDLGTWEHIWLLWNAVSAQKHPSGVCVSQLFSKPSLVLVLCFVFIFFQFRESSYFSYLSYVLVSFFRRTEWMEYIYIRRGCIRLPYMNGPSHWRAENSVVFRLQVCLNSKAWKMLREQLPLVHVRRGLVLLSGRSAAVQ